MNSKIYFLASIVLALSLVSCDNDHGANVDMPAIKESVISLNAGIASMDSTRAMEADVYTGTSAAGMEAAVWFSRECGVYEYNDAPQAPTFLPYRANVKYDNGSPTTVYVDPTNKNNPLTYPINDAAGNEVYCVGLYPNSGWECADGKSVSHAIDGATDIMFADQIVGSWETPFATQEYKHLLMWVKVEAEVVDQMAIHQWGALEDVTIESSNGVSITFPTSGIANSTIEYAEDKIEINVLGSAASLPLTSTSQMLGSLLCAPMSKIKLKVKTANIEEKIIEVALNDLSGNVITSPAQTVGKLFIINLYFNAFHNIEATCNLVPWNEQNVDLVGK